MIPFMGALQFWVVFIASLPFSVNAFITLVFAVVIAMGALKQFLGKS